MAGAAANRKNKECGLPSGRKSVGGGGRKQEKQRMRPTFQEKICWRGRPQTRKKGNAAYLPGENLLAGAAANRKKWECGLPSGRKSVGGSGHKQEKQRMRPTFREKICWRERPQTGKNGNAAYLAGEDLLAGAAANKKKWECGLLFGRRSVGGGGRKQEKGEWPPLREKIRWRERPQTRKNVNAADETTGMSAA